MPNVNLHCIFGNADTRRVMVYRGWNSESALERPNLTMLAPASDAAGRRPKQAFAPGHSQSMTER
ncbi:MAG: hypothetical protein C5B54_08280 [Acidobacteria bacterium]|nr:MAG: hypothetical protein C5B54_08280 [Acidobacteriota bacterium]